MKKHRGRQQSSPASSVSRVKGKNAEAAKATYRQRLGGLGRYTLSAVQQPLHAPQRSQLNRARCHGMRQLCQALLLSNLAQTLPCCIQGERRGKDEAWHLSVTLLPLSSVLPQRQGRVGTGRQCNQGCPEAGTQLPACKSARDVPEQRPKEDLLRILWLLDKTPKKSVKVLQTVLLKGLGRKRL